MTRAFRVGERYGRVGSWFATPSSMSAMSAKKRLRAKEL